MAHYTIKKTKSLSPLSYNEIEAEVIREDGKVYLLKQDEQGKSYKSLIEKDYEFYRLLTEEKVNTQVPPFIIELYASSACNLDCPICYEVKEGGDPSLEEIETLLGKFRAKAIGIIGREPTCRKDLFQIIRIANKRNHASLVTNGVKLSDYEYALKLKKNGLKNIFFSFNGFKDEIYQRMNGRPLLDLKLQALENIKKIGFGTILSTTIAKGINEDQIRKLCDYCLDNRSFVTELRIRATSPVGKYLEGEYYCMSELVGLVADALGISKEDIIKEHIFWRELSKAMRYIIPYFSRNYFRTRLCSFFFHIKSGEKISSLGSQINVDRIKKSKFKIILLIYYLFKIYGVRFIFERFCQVFKLPKSLQDNNILMVVLRSWPHLYNIDLDENKKCTSLYYKNGKLSPFCSFKIIESRKLHVER